MNVKNLIWWLAGALLVASCGSEEPKKKFPDADAANNTQDAGNNAQDASADLSSLCSNGVQDGNETDIDCGRDCTLCDLGQGCDAASDCAQGICAGNICALPLGSPCEDSGQCASVRCEAIGAQNLCTDDCTDTCDGQNLSCFQGRCVPDTYCEDPDGDDFGEGPGCAGTPCDLCDSNATCSQNVDVFLCHCNDGYEGDGNTCADIDECTTQVALCGANAGCVNTPGGFDCECSEGFSGDGVTCTDLNECDLDTDNCAVEAVCTNLPGTFSCECVEGFEGDGTACSDLNECALNTDNCAANATCTNTAGGFTCACPSGFSGNGLTCTDLNECALNTDNCATNALCTNTVGSFTCACPSGFSGNGLTCTDLNECALNTDNCAANATCTNTAGSFTCTCPTGYGGNGVTCTDLDECARNTDNCDPNAVCLNYPGGFSCACGTGFTGNGVTCSDLDECALNTDNCDPNAACQNVVGFYACSCDPGFTGNGFTCADIDECALNTDNCDFNAACTNTSGGFDCACNTNYVGNGVSCTKIGDTCPIPYTVGTLPFTGTGNTSSSTADYGFANNQCPGENSAKGSGSRDDAWSFTPTLTGNYRIRLQSAFDSLIYVVQDCANIGTSCLGAVDDGFSSTADIEEIDVQLTAGTPYFIIVDGWSTTTDRSGAYTLDVQLNACLNNSDNCVDPAQCEVTYPGYQCTCPTGYELQGQACVDIDECTRNTDNCDNNATCTNLAGTFSCQCPSPLIGPGTECWDPLSLGESCANPFGIDSVPFNFTSDTATAFDDHAYAANVCPGELSASGSAGADQVFRFTPTTSGTYQFLVTPATSWDPAIYLVTDCADINATTCVAAKEDGINGESETLVASLVAGTTYFFVVDAWGTTTSAGGYTLDLTCQDCP